MSGSRRSFSRRTFLKAAARVTAGTALIRQVHPRVIDLGWGALKSALVNLRDSGFVAREPR